MNRDDEIEALERMTAKLSLLLDHVKSEPVPEEAEASLTGTNNLSLFCETDTIRLYCDHKPDVAIQIRAILWRKSERIDGFPR